MKKPFLDFLKVDEHLNECLRRGWFLIEDFLKALKDLLIKVETIGLKDLLFECSCFSLSQSLVYIVDSLSLSCILWIPFLFFTFWNLL